MNMEMIEQIPVDQILVVNPRTRNRVKWLAIVASIKTVGLKKPISVSRRESPDENGKLYDLVCGQGRLEAHIELGQPSIEAILVNASKVDRQLMSLVENIARRPAPRFESANEGAEPELCPAATGSGRHHIPYATSAQNS